MYNCICIYREIHMKFFRSLFHCCIINGNMKELTLFIPHLGGRCQEFMHNVNRSPDMVQGRHRPRRKFPHLLLDLFPVAL